MLVFSQKAETSADKIAMDLLGIAQQGLQQAQGHFNQSAQRIAQIGLSPGQSQTPADSVNLSDAAVSLMSSKDQYESELGVFHTADQMQKAAINLLA
jgi:flagellar basal body rod protein FlgF